ncbi:phenoloxidase-activating factor 2-like [Drosophila sulfurigaster albostrigata]|uniref:phenoloxidase-activating factor 2-like n=1 Tax=Drosophila sulfurigaster albostrigata TaxID=89887 RepID=UPI002D21BDB6|nr:phenoloxidase-activating factor 2-like [Drosophila sulfurigaster albostrigata]
MKYSLLLCGILLHLTLISSDVVGKTKYRERTYDPTLDESSEDEVAVKSCGVQKECVPLHLCNANGTIITDGRAIIDLRTASFWNNHGCLWTETCCANGEKILKPAEEYVSRGCGYRNPNGIQLTLNNTNDNEAQFGEFPWMVSIEERVCENGQCSFRAQGGGSLLAPNVVLTTAHKIINIQEGNLRVRAGEWDKLTTDESHHHQDRLVAKMIVHPSFNYAVGFYDAALLILQTPFKLSPHIDTICLPDKSDEFDCRRCIVTGWGKKTMSDPHYPNLMKRVDLPYIPRFKCQKLLRRTRLGRYYQLHSSFVCAGGEKDRDACLGDGGAPLACPSTSSEPNRYVVAGIVSWGLECGYENVPGVYANVQLLLPWINQQLQLYQVPK